MEITPSVIIAVLATMDLSVILFAIFGWWLYLRERKSHADLTTTVIALVKDLHITLEQVAMRLR
jgi:hypothetical protein